MSDTRMDSQAARMFLDIEAGVADDSTESDTEESGDDFIDNVPDISPASGSETQPTVSWNTFEERNQDLDGFLDKLYQRSQSRRTTHNTTTSDDEDDFPIHELVLNDQDFPLWRIRCRPGVEEEAIFFLLQKVSDDYPIRSAFTQGLLRGWIYVEGLMNANVISLLKMTPGIVRKQQQHSIIYESIDFIDWKKTLQIKNPATLVEERIWVQVLQRGAYKGDIGFVTCIESWGAQVLLVPRRQVQNTDLSRKRKRTTVYEEPALFEPDKYKRLYNIDSQEQDDGSYTARGCIYEEGLLRKRFDLHSLSSVVLGISSHLFDLFQLSNHPAISGSTYPCPNEWIFEEGDKIMIRSSNKIATVAKTSRKLLEVDVPAEGVMAVPWHNIQKVFVLGDFVSVMSGPFQGRSGWVDHVNGDTVSIIERHTGGSGSNSMSRIMRFNFHANWLKLSTAPFLHASAPLESTDPLLKADKVPWLGTTVIVTKHGHQFKGYQGTVKSVLSGQATASGLKIEIQLASYDPANPFTRAFFDHDDLVEKRTGALLRDCEKPLSKLFQLSKDQQVSTPIASTSGAATPMPDSISSTPAWDPSSRTPGPIEWSATPTASSPVAGSSQMAVTDSLLDRRLIGAPLRVRVTGDIYKDSDLSVSIVEAEGCLTIQHALKNRSKILPLPWVTPTQPNPRRDNGLLVVIKGDHCGKLVRRIHHKYDDGKELIILAAVSKVDGIKEILTGEIFELPPDCLCLGSETAEGKKQNASLMTSLRADARKR